MTAHSPMNPDGPRVVEPTPSNREPDPKGRHRRRIARTQMGLVVGAIALSLLIGIAGVPGVEDPEAGNGSTDLRRGWAQRWAAQAAETDQAAVDARLRDLGEGEPLERDPAKR